MRGAQAFSLKVENNHWIDVCDWNSFFRCKNSLALKAKEHFLLFQYHMDFFLRFFQLPSVMFDFIWDFSPSQNHLHIKVPRNPYFKSSLNQFSSGTSRPRCFILLVCHLLACIWSLFMTLKSVFIFFFFVALSIAHVPSLQNTKKLSWANP